MQTKIWGTRFSLIGDSVMSLPILEVLEKQYPNSYKYFSIAKKCQQSRDLFLNHPLIDEIKISDFEEDLGETDFAIIKNCNVVINVKPNHPLEHDWYNYRNCVEETAIMAGVDPLLVNNIYPKLYLSDNKINQFKNKTIAIWPFAGYGQGFIRSPSINWWRTCLNKLFESGFSIIHCGVDSEPHLSDNKKYSKITGLKFIDQIYSSLKCNGIIGTDSGSMWVTAAYHLIPQINLITNWLPNHINNHLALAPVGQKVYNLYATGGCSNIDIDTVLEISNEIFCL